MAGTSGTFAAPGVSAAIAATTTLRWAISGLASACSVTLEKSTDSGATWSTFLAFDGILAPSQSPSLAGSYAMGWKQSATNPDHLTLIYDPTHVLPVNPAGEGTTSTDISGTMNVAAAQYRLNCTSFGSGTCSYALASI